MDGVLAGWLPAAGQGFLLHVVVAMATFIDATGLPFPGRLVLVAAGASAGDPARAATLTAAGAVGALAGDHLWYVTGRLGGRRLLSAYCRLSLGSGRCVSRAREHFERFGPLTIIIGRFVAGVRIFAAPMAGTGLISYHQYLLFDGLGALLWAGAFVGLGYLLGDQWRAVVERFGTGPVIVAALAVVLLAAAATMTVRLLRRRRHGPAFLAH
ncbi:MAG: DedA family protein [Candidatus Rokuibacteriota bacterium]